MNATDNANTQSDPLGSTVDTDRAGEEPAQHSAPALLFQVEGLDCRNEVAVLKRELGPFVGGEDGLAFDTTKGLMTVAPQRLATADNIIDRVAPTGMRASLVAGSAAEIFLYRVHGLDCKNEVAALTLELGHLVGDDKLAFDTGQGLMSVALQSGVEAARSRKRWLGRACVPNDGRGGQPLRVWRSPQTNRTERRTAPAQQC